jgi:energy-coupling factor transporter ATP-binding protein EcfA2
MEEEKFNPFVVYGITDYNQYKQFPFLETEYIKTITNTINGSIRDNFKFPERLLLLGNPGVGKTTSLFYIRDLLRESGKCAVYVFDKFFIDDDGFYSQKGVHLSEIIKKGKIYILVDFPDSISEKNFKGFLEFCWNLMIRENYQNINLIFALNKSHFNRSFTYSEILGKFDKRTFEELSREECRELIISRLRLANIHGIFEEPIYDLIYEYSKGIPRNILLASRVLVDEYFNQKSINYIQAKRVLKKEYTDKILEDRLENTRKRELFKNVLKILSTEFEGKSLNQSYLLKIFKDRFNIGKNRGMNLLNELYKFGLIEYIISGEKNREKIWGLK